MMDFSQKLAELYKERGITQAWLAEKVQCSTATISRYMTGEFYPSLGVLLRIADVLNVSLDYLVDRSLSPVPDEKPSEEIALLCSVYKRADDEHKKILWSVLEMYLTPNEKSFVTNLIAPEKLTVEEPA